MRIKKTFTHKLAIALILSYALVACVSNGPQDSNSDDTSAGSTPTPTLVPNPLTICIGEAPNTLYPFGKPNQAAQLILQTIYDGPIDHQDYNYQPVIFNEASSLANGNALIQQVEVTPGQTVLDNTGEVTALEFGTFVRPTGCFNHDCAIAFDGSQLIMDQMVVLFNMRADITWADDTPVTANDSAYGFSLDSGAPAPISKSLLEHTLSYEAVAEYQALWTGIPGYIDHTYQNNFWLPAPQHLWSDLSLEELLTAAVSAQKPTGYGPFIITSWEGNQITLQKNTKYFRASESLPLVNPLIFKVVGQDGNANLQLLLSGECDILDSSATNGLDRENVLTLQSEGRLVPAWANGNAWELINFGIQPQSYDDGYSMWAADRANFFGDVRTRQATAMCIDRQKIVDEITQGFSTVMNTYIPPDHGLSSPNVTNYPFNPGAAATLLDEAGWLLGFDGTTRIATGIPDVAFEGTKFSINYFYLDHPFSEAIAQIVKENLEQCGIEVSLTAMSAEELYATGPEAKVFGRQFDLAQFSWQAAEEPPCNLFLSEAIPGKDTELFPYKWGGWNLTGWSNASYDEACKATFGTAPGLEGYTQNHYLAQEIFANELPVVPLFTHQDIVLARPDICGLDFDPTAGYIWNVENLGYGDLCK
jgi:peptide/nickel transport system substrate-binding protein